jgi:SAM-dependent methyltransferase
MGQQDTFQDSPWNAVSTEEWNWPAFWNGYYGDLLAKADQWKREQTIYRDVYLLLRMLTDAKELPQKSADRTFLDAGCGIAVIPHLLAYWGFQVTAVDVCPRAIAWAQAHTPSAEELARCISVWETCQDWPGCHELVEDPARSLVQLRRFQSPGGGIRYIASDWFSGDLQAGAFDVIYCRNSLRCSTKSYWRQTLRRFHALLAAGGVLLLENVNAIGISDEVEELFAHCGLSPLLPGHSREPSGKYVIGVWPTG